MAEIAGDLEGEGGGKAREGSRAMGRRAFEGVLLAAPR